MSLGYRVLIHKSDDYLVGYSSIHQFWFEKENEAISFVNTAIRSNCGGSTISIEVEEDDEEEGESE